MAKMPIEIVDIGNVPTKEIDEAISIANSIQDEFKFIRLNKSGQQAFKVLSYKKAIVKDLFDNIENVRNEIRGYHPFIISVITAKLEGKVYKNLFGSHRAKNGIALITTDNVENYIIPKGRMISYFLYYFARYTTSFIIPKHKNHVESKDCIFDRKVNKEEIKNSMKAGAICDECRKELLSIGNSIISPSQLDALDKIFETSGKYLVNPKLSHKYKDETKQTYLYDAFTELTLIKDKLDIKGKKNANLNLWFFLVILVIVWILLIILTWKVGWEKLEPWTYFIGSIITLGSYAYFVITHKEFSPKNIYKQIIENKIRKNYLKFGFDIQRYNSLKENQNL